MYYFFAIIGMELFADYDMRDCCKYVILGGTWFSYRVAKCH